jgi:hypothetical protein
MRGLGAMERKTSLRNLCKIISYGICENQLFFGLVGCSCYACWFVNDHKRTCELETKAVNIECWTSNIRSSQVHVLPSLAATYQFA